MQSDVNAQILNFTDTTSQRDLSRVLRGYDTQQVDEVLGQLDAELSRQRAQTQALRRDLDEARSRLSAERPARSSLGSKVDQLLKAIDDEAAEIIGSARSAATDTTLAAEADAALLRAGGKNEAAELRGRARREADDLRAAAEREADNIKAGARNEADTITAEARSAAENLIADARSEAEQLKSQDAGAHAEAENIRSRARQDALRIVGKAQANADELVAEARELLADASREAERTRRQADELNRQGSSVAEHLAYISELLAPPAPAPAEPEPEPATEPESAAEPDLPLAGPQADPAPAGNDQRGPATMLWNAADSSR